MPPYHSISFVVPVYNGAMSLPSLIDRIRHVVAQLELDYEILLINDASRDASWQKIQVLAKADSRVIGVNFGRNFGQHNALLYGIRRARFPVTVTIDDDLQNPPEEIPKLLAKLDEGYGVVYGAPERERHGLMRDIASRLTKFALQNAIGVPSAQDVSAFRVFRTNLRDAFVDYHGSFVSIDVLLSWGTDRFSSIRVRHDHRSSGDSNYTFLKLLSHASNMITGFSAMPLQIASLIGFSASIFGLGILLYVSMRLLFQGNPVPGFPFLASIISIFAGTQLFALGIIGEYLARVHFRTMGKPQYFVNGETGHPKSG